jgi:predicted Zn-dependent protease
LDDDMKIGNRMMGQTKDVQAASYTKAGPGARWLSGSLLGLCLASSVQSCNTVPITGRTSINNFSPAEDVELGREAYVDVLKSAKVISRGSDFEMVQRAMKRLVAVSDDPGFEWEVTLIKDDAVVNAFALPGGKMAVYTGILPVCESETGLAVVMGHEIAHVIAQHGTERLTLQQGKEFMFQVAGAGEYEQLARLAVGMLAEQPYGRKYESEADHIGLIYMARAGYDPREAVAFWTRMAGGEEAVAGGSANEGLIKAITADFGSTHPSSGTRVARLKKLMPEAVKVYKQAK